MKRSFFQKHAIILIVYALILVLVVIGAFNSEHFLTLRNLTNVMRQAAYLGTAALGEMMVILIAVIDLSIRIAETSTHSFTKEPTERSMPAIKMTIISPKAAVP
jgi:ribose/xylose/arabinose/galactoside ABC-type transport system permease subunit